MKLASTGVLLALLLSALSAHAEMYKWVGPDGKITYSDTPPPKTAKSVEQKNIEGGGDVEAGNLPYELALAAKKNPVTLYTSGKCIPCDDARSFLNNRGIPFKEKTVSTNDDLAKLRQATGSTQLPVGVIGGNKQIGFEPTAWGSVLTAAGYPESNRLPKTYRNAPAEAAAPVAKLPPAETRTSAASNAPERADSLPAPAGNAPPGFRF